MGVTVESQVVSGLLEPIAGDRLTAARARQMLEGQEPVRGERGFVERGARGPAAQIGGRVPRVAGGMVVPQPVDALGMPMQVRLRVSMLWTCAERVCVDDMHSAPSLCGDFFTQMYIFAPLYTYICTHASLHIFIHTCNGMCAWYSSCV